VLRRIVVLALIGLASCAHLRPEDVRQLEETKDWGKAIEYLRDPRGWVREEAASSLGRMHAEKTRSVLESVMLDKHERGYVRAASATALAEIYDRASIGALTGVAAQNDTPPEVKLAVIGSLCVFAKEWPTEPMQAIAILTKDDDVLVSALAEANLASKCKTRHRR
jgi:HEAT repeat protein